MTTWIGNGETTGLVLSGATASGTDIVIDAEYIAGGLIANISPVAGASSEISANFLATFAFDTDLSKTGSAADDSWLANLPNTNHVLWLDRGAGSNGDLWGFQVNNYHDAGSNTNVGIQNVKAYLSDTLSDTTEPAGTVTGTMTEAFDGVFTEHPATDTVDNKDYTFSAPVGGRYVILHAADNHGNAYLGIRSIQLRDAEASPSSTATATFPADWGANLAADNSTAAEVLSGGVDAGSYLDNETPSATATSFLDPTYAPALAFNTALAVTGSRAATSWMSANGQVADQTLVIDLAASGLTELLWGLEYSNMAHTSDRTASGVRATKYYHSLELSDTTLPFGTVTGTMTELFDGDFVKNPSPTGIDPDFQAHVFPDQIQGGYVIFYFSTNWGDGSFMGLREINFKEAIIIAAPTATWQLTTDEPPVTFNGTELTVAQVQAYPNTDLQTAKYQITLTGAAGGRLNQISLADQSPDVTPPAGTTGSRAYPGANWVLGWLANAEADIVTWLRRDVSGVTYYLANVAGRAEWVSILPANFYTFSRDNLTADSQFLAAEFDEILVGFEGYRAKDVDLSGNESTWGDKFTEIEVDYPAVTDVRDGTFFNNGGLEGTAAIPTPNNVRKTVPVDATVGTLHVSNVSESDVRLGVDY